MRTLKELEEIANNPVGRSSLELLSLTLESVLITLESMRDALEDLDARVSKFEKKNGE